MLYTLNATRSLYTNQHKLRKVLKYQINYLDQSQEQASIEEEINQPAALLVQKLLTKATQPSPVKSCFNLQQMQLAALNLSQYLAAEGNFDKTIYINNDKVAMKVTEMNSELPTPNSECSIKSVVSERSGKKKKNEESNQLPLNPIIGQIVEMGFTKKSVENAMKSLG